MSVPIRIGVLKLADSAPVIMARQKGIFARYGLETEIVVSPSWANIADGLAWNRLDAAVLFAPLALMTMLGRRGHDTVLHPLSRISRGGNTIMLRGVNPVKGVWKSGAEGREIFDIWQAAIGRKPRIAVVHIYSTHLLILRRFLKMIDVDMDREVEILVMPPTDMISAFSEKEIDGCCVGAPWGMEAEQIGLAFCVGGSSTVLPDHLEKMLVVSDALFRSADTARRMFSAMQESLSFCRMPEHREEIAEILALPLSEGGLTLPREATFRILPGGTVQETLGFAGGEVQFPDIKWIINDMAALGWLDHDECGNLVFWTDSPDARLLHAHAPSL
ncbi:CmpA/NrtA family ABC transporter substrate-binding protein [Acetobacter fallax]|uniref:Nitrate ABC transporter ATP-binding protein n=1 Tax=Acetobacter fallax TaxID=1737473 RepID=A0ABX0KGL1_9PROT|nr:CmpA/NrtA family ABC transporter substrate-binding protein [Acetobacter fallax]NHO34233.1 nitrate ABC transporter ATP-binding protein [Acetobacter fallax]NHO37777.1 nitrate ABC transporter ATP-binding protein [Acetobacter fallax]